MKITEKFLVTVKKNLLKKSILKLDLIVINRYTVSPKNCGIGSGRTTVGLK